MSPGFSVLGFSPMHNTLTSACAAAVAMAGAVLGLRTPGLRIMDVDTTRKTLPKFTTLWRDMLGAAS